jgi:membrane protein implicated in regulation of membrane protease activity
MSRISYTALLREVIFVIWSMGIGAYALVAVGFSLLDYRFWMVVVVYTITVVLGMIQGVAIAKKLQARQEETCHRLSASGYPYNRCKKSRFHCYVKSRA